MRKKNSLQESSIKTLQEEMIAESIKRVDAVDKDFSEFEEKHKEKIYQTLNDIYVEYYQFKDTELELTYFEEIENYLSSKGVFVQADTSNALKLVKAVFKKKRTVNKSQLSKYAKVIQLAKAREVEPSEFFEWVKSQGIEKISRNNEKLPASEGERNELARARILLLKWLEIKDANPTAITDIAIEDLPTSVVDVGRYEVAICKIRPHPTDNKKAQLHTYWVLPRTEKTEKFFLMDLAWALVPRLDAFADMVQNDNLAVFGAEVQAELDFAEQKNIALEQYLRDCHRQNSADAISGEGLGNAFCKPFTPPKRQLLKKDA
jgi:hypothetical protein